jgi:membrane protein implicated in regulation of membrane protease activity
VGEKFTAWFVAAAVIAPVCAACILGPAVIVSIFAGAVGWFGGLDVFATAGLVLIAGFSVYGLVGRRRAQRPPKPLREKISDER